MPLFNLGDFKLHSGVDSNWIIDCNELTDDDLACLAHIGRALVGSFGEVHGIPNGGLRFATALTKYSTIGPTLIVDDVFTTGVSMNKRYTGNEKGLVIFSRNRNVPDWITPIFTTPYSGLLYEGWEETGEDDD